MEFEFEKTKRYDFTANFISMVKGIESFKQLMRMDPISPRNDERLFGAIDAKIVDSNMVKKGEVIAISGPTINTFNKPFSYNIF